MTPATEEAPATEKTPAKEKGAVYSKGGGKGKKQYCGSGILCFFAPESERRESGSRINTSDHISKSSVTIFMVML
jgi:hypothetical protein